MVVKAVHEWNQRADELRNESKETLIGIILAHELEVLEVSELAFGDMYDGRVPFTRADIMDRLKEFEEKALFWDRCEELLLTCGREQALLYLSLHERIAEDKANADTNT